MYKHQSKSSGVKTAGFVKAAEVNSALLINRSHRSAINLSIARSGRKELEKMLKEVQVDKIDKAQETDIKRCDLNIILRKLTPADILSSASKKDSLFKTGIISRTTNRRYYSQLKIRRCGSLLN